MSIYELRINRMPVTPNRKCEGCVHYDGNVAKGGACEVGTQPTMCGDGSEMKYGYAPLANLGPDEIDDLATPTLVGGVGAMNETGALEKTIEMKRVTLGEEDLTIAQRIHGELSGGINKAVRLSEVPTHAPYGVREEPEAPLMYRVAKSLRDLHFAPRKQVKFDLHQVLDFLKENGFNVTGEDYAAAGDRVEKGGEGSRGGNVVAHTKKGKAIYGSTSWAKASHTEEHPHGHYHVEDHGANQHGVMYTAARAKKPQLIAYARSVDEAKGRIKQHVDKVAADPSQGNATRDPYASVGVKQGAKPDVTKVK